MTLEDGRKLGPYEIVCPIGAGGMGEVYRARDARLRRDVAIKVLPERTARDERALARFRRETRALATLSHPNILMILDVGESDGVSYAVMELLEGETLRERLRRTGFDWRKAIEIAASIADGLAAAHSREVIHRDLKPENLFLTRDGLIKILDFGLARTGMPANPEMATMTAATQPGVVLGTVNYMSPEQVRGEPTDARSDIFSLGCVLYEMLSGRPPFARGTAPETMTAILREHPERASELTTGRRTPSDADPIVARCLEKSPNDRFHSATDLAFSLRDILSRTQLMSSPRKPTRRSVILVGAVVVVIASWFLIKQFVPLGAPNPPAPKPAFVGDKAGHSSSSDMPDKLAEPKPERRLAVLPFDDLSEVSKEWFADGITEAVSFGLAELPGLWVPAYQSVRKFRAAEEPIHAASDELSLSHVVRGSVSRAANRVQIRVQLIEAATGKQIWSNRFDGTDRDYLTLQDDVARSIASAVQINLTPALEARLTQSRQVDPQAYESYMFGMSLVRQETKESLLAALKHFDDALARAPNFALGYVGRAAAYSAIASDFMPPREAMPKVKEAAEKAIALDPNLAEAHALLGMYYNSFAWDWEAARNSFELALTLNPACSKARLGYAMYLSAMNREKEAMAQLEIVAERDPQSRLLDPDYFIISYMARDYDRTISDARTALAIDDNWWAAHENLALALSQKGRHDEAVEHARKSINLTQNSPGHVAMAGGVLAVAGGKYAAEALDIYETLKGRELEGEYVCPYELASIPLGLGDVDLAFREMDRACEVRADCLAWLQVDPRLDPIRNDPRFDTLLVRVGFESNDPDKPPEAEPIPEQ